MILLAETIEEKPIDRQYNRNGCDRTTHYETMANGISYCLRGAYKMQIVIIEERNEENNNSI